MLKHLKLIMVTLMILLSMPAITALDLPTKNINGETYHYYVVKQKETVYSLCKRFGISKDEMVKYNPAVADGLKTGMTLYFPAENNVGSEVDIEVETMATPAVSTQVAQPTVPTITPQTVNDVQPATISTSNDKLSIVVMLPFMLNERKPSQNALKYTEFYKGILLAANEQKSNGQPITIYAYDTADSLDRVKNILTYPELKSADIIIAPSDNRQYVVITEFAKEHGNYVLNAFSANDKTYTRNSQILHANIPRDMMYAKAFEYLCNTYNDYTFVFLISEGGKNDKGEFAIELQATLGKHNIKYSEILYAGELENKHLTKLKKGGKYLFIPLTSSGSEFRKIAPQIIAMQESASNKNDIRLFGFPEWGTFKGENLNNLHRINATIYSRFFNDNNAPSSRAISEAFNQWFGIQMIESYPIQGILGYDLGTLLIKSLRNNSTFGKQYDGVQSAFEFISASETGGYVNNSLYIINYNADGSIDRKLY